MFAKIFEFLADLPSHQNIVTALGFASLVSVLVIIGIRRK